MDANQKELIGLTVLVVLIVGVAIPIVINMLANVTHVTYVTNESKAAVANNTYFTVAHYPVDYTQASSYLTFYNGSGTTGTNQFTLGANGGVANITGPYNTTIGGSVVSYNGTFYAANINTTSTLNVSYAYQNTGYDTSSSDRTILNILPLAFGVVGLVVIFNAVGLLA